MEKLHSCEADEIRTSPCDELPRSVVKSFVRLCSHYDFCDLFLLFPLPSPSPLPLLPTQLGKLSQSLREGRGRSQANILEGVAKLEKEHKNTIDAMGKAFDEEKDEEKERCRASLEKV